MDFEFGDLILIQIAVLTMMKDLDITLESAVAMQQLVAKTEEKLKVLREVAKDQLPESLAPDSPVTK